ncbi:MAG: hypothetical protein HC871_01680 [Rhizobiales bacterium]|nr:hypothetical protein [Hyphomicrobiales bacterium]
MPPASGGVTSQELLDGLLRRKGLILLAMIVGGLIAYHAARTLPPWYTASGLLVVDTRRSNIPELETLTSNRTVEPWGGRSEARVLTSQQMIDLLVQELDLVRDPEFNDTLRPHGLQALAGVSWIPGPIGHWIASFGEPVEPRFDREIEREVARLIGESLNAFSEERSYAIEVEFNGQDPEKSARLVNTLMELYVERQVEDKRAATQQSSEGLKAKLDELQQELALAQAKVREEEGNVSLINTPEGTIISRDLADLVKQRRTLRAERDQLAADLGQLIGAIAGGALTALDAGLVTPSCRPLGGRGSRAPASVGSIPRSRGAPSPAHRPAA